MAAYYRVEPTSIHLLSYSTEPIDILLLGLARTVPPIDLHYDISINHKKER